MPEEPKPEVNETRPFRSVEHVRWTDDVWRVVEKQLYVTENGVEKLEARAIRTEARVGSAWSNRVEGSTMGVQALKMTIFSLVDELAAKEKLHADFKAALEAKTVESAPKGEPTP